MENKIERLAKTKGLIIPEGQMELFDLANEISESERDEYTVQEKRIIGEGAIKQDLTINGRRYLSRIGYTGRIQIWPQDGQNVFDIPAIAVSDDLRPLCSIFGVEARCVDTYPFRKSDIGRAHIVGWYNMATRNVSYLPMSLPAFLEWWIPRSPFIPTLAFPSI